MTQASKTTHIIFTETGDPIEVELTIDIDRLVEYMTPGLLDNIRYSDIGYEEEVFGSIHLSAKP